MEIKIVKGGFRFYATVNIRKVTTVMGVNSKIDEVTHFIIWDFDNLPLVAVRESLRAVQQQFNLPEIHIINSGKPTSWHAYCFKACTWLEVRTVVVATPNIDLHYCMAALGRGYFTLRFSDMPTRGFKAVDVIPSNTPPDLSYHDVSNFVQYTKAEG